MRLRLLNGALALLLLLFAVAQFNDPDASLWILIYGLGALWTGLAALAPGVLAFRPVSMMLSLTMAGAILLTIAFWPDTPGFWRTEVWWETETAREGLGLIVVCLALLAPLATSVQTSRAKRRQSLADRERQVEERRRAALGGDRAADI